jgi:hypothetical protein
MSSTNSFEWEKVLALVDEIAEGQQKTVRRCANQIIPHITDEDLLQPNDFPELENHPHFRYEEGVLAGILTVRMALAYSIQEDLKPSK